MKTFRVALFAATLLSMPLGACSRGGAPDVAFVPTRAAEHQSQNVESAFSAAKEKCLEEARRKGISSVTRILLLRGKTSESDYIECMEAKGFAEADG